MRYPTFSSTEIKASAFTRSTKKTMEEVINILTENLKKLGFEVIMHLNVSDIIKQKIGINFRRYEILEVWNPLLAYQAISYESHMGLAATCKILIQEHENGEVEVFTVNPMELIDSSNPSIETIEHEISNCLHETICMIH